MANLSFFFKQIMQQGQDNRIIHDGPDIDPEGPLSYSPANVNNDPILSWNAGDNADARLTHSDTDSGNGNVNYVSGDSNISNSSTPATREFIALNDCRKLEDTPFSTKIELTADYQGSHIVLASNELFGAAANLIKTTVHTLHPRLPNEEGM
jgi:hypothetical protein